MHKLALHHTIMDYFLTKRVYFLYVPVELGQKIAMWVQGFNQALFSEDCIAG